MGSISLMHWVIVGLVVLVLFGRGKISETMGDFGQGIRSFRKGMQDDDSSPEPARIAQGTNSAASDPVIAESASSKS